MLYDEILRNNRTEASLFPVETSSRFNNVAIKVVQKTYSVYVNVFWHCFVFYFHVKKKLKINKQTTVR